MFVGDVKSSRRLQSDSWISVRICRRCLYSYFLFWYFHVKIMTFETIFHGLEIPSSQNFTDHCETTLPIYKICVILSFLRMSLNPLLHNVTRSVQFVTLSGWRYILNNIYIDSAKKAGLTFSTYSCSLIVVKFWFMVLFDTWEYVPFLSTVTSARSITDAPKNI